MAAKKKGVYLTGKKNDKRAQGRTCVYCGKQMITDKAPFYVKVKTREFPVCSAECQKGTEAYLANDRKYKLPFYLCLMVCAVMVLIGAFMGENPYFLYPALMIGGFGVAVFPYPISNFETFFSSPIKRTTLITRVIGIGFLLLGAFFLANTVFSLGL